MPQITQISWDEIFKRISGFEKEFAGKKIFGVPKNGMLLLSFFKGIEVVPVPEQADIIFDDIYDSGKTAKEYEQYNKPFIVMFDKRNEFKNQWIQLPFEKEKDINDCIVRVLEYIGEDASREGLLDTPKRVVKSWKELFSGYGKDPKDILTTFADGACDEMVILKDQEFYSTCEHHMIPFFGKIHIGYIPDGKVLGISKLARLTEIYARRLQIQEKLVTQIADDLMKYLDPKGCMVVAEAQHMCMTARGVQKQDSIMITSAVRGVFKDNIQTKQEFLSLILK